MTEQYNWNLNKILLSIFLAFALMFLYQYFIDSASTEIIEHNLKMEAIFGEKEDEISEWFEGYKNTNRFGNQKLEEKRDEKFEDKREYKLFSSKTTTVKSTESLPENLDALSTNCTVKIAN